MRITEDKIEELTAMWLNIDPVLKMIHNETHELCLNHNRTTKLMNSFEQAQSLKLASNGITKIENLPSSIQKLDLSDNEITKIENLPNTLQELDLSNNKISELPLSLMELKHLKVFKYDDNLIVDMHPQIAQWLKKFDEPNK